MSVTQDLTGQTIHGIYVVRQMTRVHGQMHYECRCPCGGVIWRQPARRILAGETANGKPIRCSKCAAAHRTENQRNFSQSKGQRQKAHPA